MTIRIKHIIKYFVFEVQEENMKFETSLIDSKGADYFIDMFEGLIEDMKIYILDNKTEENI